MKIEHGATIKINQEVLENPLEDLFSIFGLEFEKQSFFPLKDTGDKLSIIPEYLSPMMSQFAYGIDKVLMFNCAVQRDGKNIHFTSFVDEKEVYAFMSSYTIDKYKTSDIVIHSL